MASSVIYRPSAVQVSDNLFFTQYTLDVAGGGVLGVLSARWATDRSPIMLPDFTNAGKVVRVLSIPVILLELTGVFGVNQMADAWLDSVIKGCSASDIILTHTSAPCTGVPVVQKLKFVNPVLLRFNGVGTFQTGFTFWKEMVFNATDIIYEVV